MRRFVALVLLVTAAVMAGCAAPGSTGKTCTQYSDRQVSQSYCAQQAPQTCRTYCDDYGCRTSCGGGGYCQSTARRMVTVRECVAFVCAAGYQRFENGCFTPQQIVARKERRADDALAVVAREWDLPRNSDKAIDAAGFALRVGLYRIDADPERAFAFLERECDKGRGGGCYGLAKMYLNPRDGVPEEADPDTAEALMRKGCNVGYGSACSGLADRVRPKASDGVEYDPDADFASALELYRLACDGGSAWGCNQAAALYEHRHVAAENPGARAYVLYQQSCNTRNGIEKISSAEACVNAARYIYSGVDNLAPDERKGRSFIRRAIKLDRSKAESDPVTACILDGRGSCGLDVADARIGAAGLIDDFENATADELLAAAMALNWGTGQVRKDDVLARAYAQRACELRDGRGCHVAGQLAWYSKKAQTNRPFTVESTDLLNANRQEAILWLERSCRFGDGYGCRMLGNVWFAANPVGSVVNSFGQAVSPMRDANLEDAFKAFEAGCSAGLPYSCEDAADMLLEGHVTDPQPARRAYELLSEGCVLAVATHSANACVFAARLAYNGAEGVPRDRARAAELMGIARDVSTDDDPYDGSGVLHADVVGHCIQETANDAC
ncbi:MAG: hypothetical protein AAFQ62_01515 [Pseudomonadota bacterium]